MTEITHKTIELNENQKRQLTIYRDEDYYGEGEGLDTDCINFISRKKGHSIGIKHSYTSMAETEKDYPSTEFYSFKIFAYEHSGVIYSLDNTSYPFNCSFDGYWAGYCFLSKNAWLTYRDAKDYLQSCIEAQNAINAGNVYGYVIELITTCKCCGQEIERTTEDRLGGFYVLKDMQSYLDKEWLDVGIQWSVEQEQIK